MKTTIKSVQYSVLLLLTQPRLGSTLRMDFSGLITFCLL